MFSPLPPRWLERAMVLAEVAATWSKDPSTQVGAAILRPNKTVASLGFNGFPAHEADDARLSDRQLKYSLIIHAEDNALRSCADRYLVGYTMAVTLPPCTCCARKIASEGIGTVVVRASSWDSAPDRWRDDFEAARSFLKSEGIRYVLL